VVQGAFGTVIIVVSLVAVVVALFALASSGRTWSSYGKGMVMDRDPAPRASAVGREEDIEALLAARNARRARRGLPPLDRESEIARLSGAPPPDVEPELAEEVRQLVLARNARRIRAGKSPLDVEAEVVRELRRVAEM
jgi:hypothetical protein